MPVCKAVFLVSLESLDKLKERVQTLRIAASAKTQEPLERQGQKHLPLAGRHPLRLTFSNELRLGTLTQLRRDLSTTRLHKYKASTPSPHPAIQSSIHVLPLFTQALPSFLCSKTCTNSNYSKLYSHCRNYGCYKDYPPGRLGAHS